MIHKYQVIDEPYAASVVAVLPSGNVMVVGQNSSGKGVLSE
jgi:hypothetical protein